MTTWHDEVTKLRREVQSGMVPLDAEIEPIVTGLRLLGFETFSSCGGHWIPPVRAPYVMTKSGRASQLFQQWKLLNERVADPRHVLLKEARSENLKQARILVETINEFHRQVVVNFDAHLIVSSVGYESNRLYFANSEIVELENGAVIENTIRRFQEHMALFGEFLEQKFTEK